MEKKARSRCTRSEPGPCNHYIELGYCELNPGSCGFQRTRFELEEEIESLKKKNKELEEMMDCLEDFCRIITKERTLLYSPVWQSHSLREHLSNYLKKKKAAGELRTAS